MNSSNKTFSVTELNSIVRGMLETRIGEVRVKGEISNFSKPASGHMYFTLKDSKAQVRCAFFRNRSLRLKLKPANGQEVVAIGRLSLYEARGEYQMIVESLEEAGEGALQLKFEKLKQKLYAEGLFDQELKRELPKYPRQIGIITSGTGAALQDILHVLDRRYPALKVLVYSVAVQGENSEKELIKALKTADRNQDNDVLLISRGGGSIEDLWSFNSEELARLIVETRAPVVTGIGHEIDFTIADFAADHRAPTPSAAAELISPDTLELTSKLAHLRAQLTKNLSYKIEQRSQSTDLLSRQILKLHPQKRLKEHFSRSKELRNKLNAIIKSKSQFTTSKIANIQIRLQAKTPLPTLDQSLIKEKRLRHNLELSMAKLLDTSRQNHRFLTRTLENLAPQNTLDRGYAIVTNDLDHKIVRDPSLVRNEDNLTIKLSKGSIGVIVSNKNSP